MTDNTLTMTLERAAKGEVSSAEFYQTLMRSDILVIGSTGRGAEDEAWRTLQKEDTLNIQNWMKDDDTPIIPFFTSLEALQKSISHEVSYVALSAEAFLNITKGSHLILNPGSDYGKEFTPHEVSLLIGQPDAAGIIREVVKEDTPVLIGQPAKYPHAMINALLEVLPLYKTIEQASLALVSTPDKTPKQTLMIGLDAQSDIHPTIPELIAYIRDKIPEDSSIAFMQVNEADEGLSEYMRNETKPFYSRETPSDGRSKKPNSTKTEASRSKPWYKFWS